MSSTAPQFTLRARLKAIPKANFEFLWLILFTIMSVVTLNKTFPVWQGYLEKEIQIKQMGAQNLEAENTINALEIKITEQENLRDEKGKDFIRRESQWLPEKLETARIAALLEMLTLQLENLDFERDAHFNLKTLQFPTSTDKDNTYPVTMTFSTDAPNLKLFIDYLQNGTIPQVIRRGVNQKFITPNILSTLESYSLPLAKIKEIQINQDDRNNQLKVSLKLNFYSKPL